MAGGNWTTQNKILPGIYTNFTGSGPGAPLTGARGIVGLPALFPWLPKGEPIAVQPRDVAGYVNDYGDYAITLREAAKNASLVYLYKLNEGTKAAATLGNLVCTALYGGTFGNRLTVSIESVIGESGWFNVLTWIDGREADRQKVQDAAGLADSQWIHFTHMDPALVADAGTPLTGGADGTITAGDYQAFLAAMETREFQALACTSNDADIKAMFVEYAKRLRNDEGRYIQVVVPEMTGVDFEGVISIKNGVVLEGGTAIDKVKATAYVAGATAGVPLTASLTNAVYPGAVDVDARFTLQQQEDLAKSGQFVFIPGAIGSGKVVAQKDINTLTTFTETTTYAFSKNKIIRTMDAVGSYITQTGMENFIGKVQNTPAGRDLFKSDVLSYLRSLESQGALREVSPADINIRQGELIDAVVVDYAIRPADTMDVIYNTIVVEG